MSVIIRILQLILSLSILVLIHELGHFAMAKSLKARVEKFYLFFNPWFTIFKFRKGETEYGLGWLPLGGYTKIAGMIDESMDIEQMKQPPQPWEYRSKKAWERLLIMIGGVLFNFILALLIYITVLFAWGESYLPTSSVKYGIVTDSTGYSIGLRNGDIILSSDNIKIEKFQEIRTDIILNNRKSIQVQRDGRLLNISIPPDLMPKMLKGLCPIEPRSPFGKYVISYIDKTAPAKAAGIMLGDEVRGIDDSTFVFLDQFQGYISRNKGHSITLDIIRNGQPLKLEIIPNSAGKIGIGDSRTYSQIFQLKTIKYNLFQSVPAGIRLGFKTIGDYLKQFRIIFSRHTKAYESLGGFITIGSIFPPSWDWQIFWNLTAFLSIILAIMNLLPIPGLDGGHVMFLLFEVITGRKPSDKFMEYAQIVGMAILIALLLLANGNDVFRLLKKYF
ncbi:MAG: RIP metalloprotease RseP [Bacteroidales bacterium]|jgi:regulator of sigma E protease